MTMAARSSIARLPKDLAELCHRLIREGRTIHEITDKLNELDADVSKSAVGRYVKGAREQMARYSEAQEIAGQWVAQLGENPKGDVGALLAEMLKTVAFQSLAGMGSDEPGADGKPPKAPKPMDIMLLAKAIRDLEATSKANIERLEKIERAVIERAAKKAGEIGKRTGLSQATIDEIQKELRLL
jgi:hypothetical protein